MKEAPTYKHKEWLARAFRVREMMSEYDPGPVSVGVPTWLYGHEPPTPFASVIAKYFECSLRQESLLTIALSGVVFAPGSAGTVHELFQHLVQNHYGTVDRASAMILMGARYWGCGEAAPSNDEIEYRPVRDLVKNLSKDEPYASLIAYLDDPEEIIKWIDEHPPVTVAASEWTFCSAHCSDSH